MEELWDSACIKVIRTPQEANVGIWDRALFTGAKHAAPVFRNYVDILAGNQGKLKSMLGWGATIEGGILGQEALYPSKTYEPISPVDQVAPVDMPSDIRMDTKKSNKIENKIVADVNNTQVKDYTSDTEKFEENQSGASDADNDTASVAANDENLSIDNDSISRINKYKDVMRQVL